MNAAICFALFAFVSCGPALYFSPIPAIAPVRTLPLGPSYVQQQGNAASATQDTGAISGDQITKPAGAKGATLTGCLAGPNKDGKFMLRSMAHRAGVEVVGPEDLKNNSGSKVKLTGQWQPLPPDEAAAQAADKKSAETRRFQATYVEVLAQKCKPPSETTPISKNKPQKPTTYNTPTSDDSK